uniref:Putative Transmembrane protein 6/97 n=1 Tax=Davidia involucrata TaxID=16924 RepID=A0A5B7B3B0_DAVIN
MGALTKLIDAILFLCFIVIALAVPLIEAQMVLPVNYFPDFLVDLKVWYTREVGHYLVIEKPDFFVGLALFELVFQWPLSVFNLYGIAAGKSWFSTTCLVYGVSFSTSLVAILAELVGSRKASDKLLMMYYPFIGFAVLAILRGLLPHSAKTPTIGKRPALHRKKKA